MTQKVPWLRVFVEGVVIVGSILLAFGIDAWWDQQQDRALELEYSQRLMADLSADTAGFSDFNSRLRVKVEVLEDLSEPGSVSILARDPSATVRRLQSTTMWGIWQSRSAAFTEMQSSGRLILLQDPRLRDDLASYYAFYAFISSRLAESYGQYRQLLMSTVPGTVWEAYNVDPSDVDRDGLERGLRALVAHPQFESTVNAELGYTATQIDWHGNFIDQATELLDELSEAYPDS